jgi:hypothetical protein
MKRILLHCLWFIALIYIPSSCSLTNESSQQDFDGLVVSSFNRYNQNALSKYDSCFVVNSVKRELSQMGGSMLHRLYGVEILSYTVPSTGFSFAMVRRTTDTSWTFFGAFEHYRLSHWNQADSAKLIALENDNLNAVVNKLFTVKLVQSDTFSLKTFLHELYYENHRGLYRPIFDEDVRIPNLSEYLTKEQIDILGEDDDLIVFEDEILGLAIFKCGVANDKIVIKQFVFPFGKYKFLGFLDVPPAFRDCDYLD